MGDGCALCIIFAIKRTLSGFQHSPFRAPSAYVCSATLTVHHGTVHGTMVHALYMYMVPWYSVPLTALYHIIVRELGYKGLGYKGIFD